MQIKREIFIVKPLVFRKNQNIWQFFPKKAIDINDKNDKIFVIKMKFSLQHHTLMVI